jgi:peptidylprolyl isomerase
MKNVALLVIGLLCACSLFAQSKQEPVVLINTKYGDIKIKLYKETPKHRDNFIKLAKEGYFDGCLFHRVIKDFMIQGGDPDSKTAKPGQLLGDGGPTYTVPFEYVPKYFHKKGVLAAARESDDVNPERASSGSQFYIVVGKVFVDSTLAKTEKRINTIFQKNLMYNYIAQNKEIKDRLASLKTNDTIAYASEMKKMEKVADSLYKLKTPYKIPENERAIYKTIGGTPHLDGSYTIFGEVIEGIEVAEKISVEATDKNDRPLENIVMKVFVLTQKEHKK